MEISEWGKRNFNIKTQTKVVEAEDFVQVVKGKKIKQKDGSTYVPKTARLQIEVEGEPE